MCFVFTQASADDADNSENDDDDDGDDVGLAARKQPTENPLYT